MHPIQVMPKPSTTKIREFRRWRISPQIVIAGLLTLFLFIGRWTPMRLAEGSDDNSSSLTIAEPRFIILLLLVTLLMYMSKASFRTYSQQLPKFVSSLTRSTEAAIPVCSKRARPTFLAMLSFFAYMIFTGVWSSDTSAAIHKSYELALILVCVYILSVFQDSRSLREYFIQLIVSLTVVLSVLGLVGLAKSGDTSRLSVLGGGPIVFGRNMAMMLVCCLFYTFKYRRGVFWPTLAVLAIALVLASGSRGALISAGVGCMTYLVMRKPAWKNIFMLLAVFCCWRIYSLHFATRRTHSTDIRDKNCVSSYWKSIYIRSRRYCRRSYPFVASKYSIWRRNWLLCLQQQHRWFRISS